MARLLSAIRGGRRPAPASRKTWQEFEITPDVYLRVRSDHDASQLQDFERVAAHLREILLGGDLPDVLRNLPDDESEGTEF